MSQINEPNTLANSMAPFTVSQGSIEHAMKYGQDAIKALSECQGRYANFVTTRLAEDLAMPGRLAECRTPMDVLEVWAGFYRTATQQYGEHLRAMTEMGQKIATEAAEEISAEAEDTIKAAEDTIKVARDAAETNVSPVKTKAA